MEKEMLPRTEEPGGLQSTGGKQRETIEQLSVHVCTHTHTQSCSQLYLPHLEQCLTQYRYIIFPEGLLILLLRKIR